MRNNYGKVYLEVNPGVLRTRDTYAVKKTRFGFLVYSLYTDKQVGVFPTKLRAYYVAAKYNNVDTTHVFHFGDIL